MHTIVFLYESISTPIFSLAKKKKKIYSLCILPNWCKGYVENKERASLSTINQYICTDCWSYPQSWINDFKGFQIYHRGALHAFHQFHQVHKSLYLFFSKNSNVMLFSFSFNFWKGIKKKKKKSDYELLWESWGFYRGRLCQCRPLKLCLQQSTSRSFAFFSFVFWFYPYVLLPVFSVY